MKRFSKFLAEDTLALAKGQTGFASDSAGEISVFDIANPDAIDRLNFAISETLAGTVSNPFTLVQRVRNKLALVGLHFELAEIPHIPDLALDAPDNPSPPVIIEMPLTQWGGKLGYLTDDSGEISSDDGIIGKVPGGLNMRLEFRKWRGRVNVNAMILPNDTDDEGEGEK